MEYVANKDEVASSPATLERKDNQLIKPALIRLLPLTLVHRSVYVVSALQQVDVSP